jgi:excisionase family DNA binding protein
MNKMQNEKQITMTESAVMSRTNAAQYLGVTPKTLAVWASTGRYALPMIKVGRLAKYRKSDLDTFINNRLV